MAGPQARTRPTNVCRAGLVLYARRQHEFGGRTFSGSISVGRTLSGPAIELTSSYPGIVRASIHTMKFLKLYLVGYFLLLVGAVLALWQAGVLKEIPGVWLAIAAVVAIGFGIMLAVASAPRVTTTTREIR